MDSWENYDTWEGRGRYYGYPKCCIEAFINLSHFNHDNWINPFAGTGFVPCYTCSKTKTKEQMVEEINSHRIHHIPFTLHREAHNDWMIKSLEEKGYAYPKLFSFKDINQINTWLPSLQLKKAGTVKGTEADYRGDLTHWIDGKDAVEELILDRLGTLKKVLDQNPLTRSNEIEAHVAYYPPNAKYGPHFDAIKNNNKRLFSIVAYLNEDWSPMDAGILRMYAPNGIVDICPKAGNDVIFLSNEIEHEVLTTHSDRWSITAWFRY